jgi:c-di-GMP-binding flagellar brake protein YcgR
MKEQYGQNIERILIETIQNGNSVFAWKSLNGVIEKCELKAKAIRKEYNEIELEVVEKEQNKIENILSGDREINFYIPEFSISFSTEIKNLVSKNRIKVIIPKSFSFFERRKHERVVLDKAIVSLEINKRLIKKPAFDISVGGVALVIPLTEKIMIKKGLEIQTCILEVNLRKIKVKLECISSQKIDRYKLETLPYGGQKLSFRFAEISKEDREFLAEMIAVKVIQSKGLKGA